MVCLILFTRLNELNCLVFSPETFILTDSWTFVSIKVKNGSVKSNMQDLCWSCPQGFCEYSLLKEPCCHLVASRSLTEIIKTVHPSAVFAAKQYKVITYIDLEWETLYNCRGKCVKSLQLLSLMHKLETQFFWHK